jgi:hypothetical protein
MLLQAIGVKVARGNCAILTPLSLGRFTGT